MSGGLGKTIPLHLYIAYIFVGLITAYALVTNWYQYQQTSRIMVDAAGDRIQLFAEQTSARVHSLYGPALIFTEQLAVQHLAQSTSLAQRLDSLNYIVTGLQLNPELASAYVGYPNGDFFLVRPFGESPPLRALLNPPARTSWIVQSIEHEGDTPRGEYLFFDEQLNLLARRLAPDYHYDPRTRSWYHAAQTRNEINVGEPGLFFTTKEVGVTFSRASPQSGVVAATDLSLQTLQKLIGRQRLTPNTQLVLLNAQGEVLSWHDEAPTLRSQPDGSQRLPQLSELLTTNQLQILQQLQADGTGMAEFEQSGSLWQGMAVKVSVPHAQPMRLWAGAPQAELVADAVTIRNHSTFMALGFLAAGIAAAYFLSRLASRALDGLVTEADSIERFEFSRPVDVRTHITEIANLAHSMGSMKNTIRRFLDLSSALANEQNFQNLLCRLLDEFKTVTGAHGGIVYLADETGGLKAAHADWHGRCDWDTSQLRKLDQPAQIIASAAIQGLSNRKSLPAEQARELFGALVAEHAAVTLLTVPLRDRNGELLGALALFVDESQHSLSPELVAFTEALSGTAAVALNTQRLIEEQKVLLESFIEVIAGAIDAKSAHTGGHCQRVPELAKLIAQAACDSTEAPFADFKLSDNEWEELRIGAWLHDCGKVTMPEYIVDKATKLETLYDRIHEVRMRFEILKRDAEIIYWQALAAGGAIEPLQAELHTRWAELDAEFAFVAECNQGGEFMSAAHMQRLQIISERTWRRTLSDRIGLSHEELARKSTTPEPKLPCTEPLLADKPEHIFERGSRDRIADNNPWGFKIDVPEHLYNRGELYNLQVARGTLSAEERYKINEHMIQTIKMLDQLPFPRHLSRVPEIAGGHHEKMDGTGYPKRLKSADMSTLARMMAVADIFEALTAVDRPYKKGKTLSEAVQIMSRMAREQHIDRDIFALFLNGGVYLDYAQRFMRPEQIDEVDVESAL